MIARVLAAESVKGLIKAHINYYISQLRDMHAICLGPSSTAARAVCTAASTGLGGDADCSLGNKSPGQDTAHHNDLLSSAGLACMPISSLCTCRTCMWYNKSSVAVFVPDTEQL